MAVGFKMGNTTRQNVPSGEQPSMVAASSIPSGTVLIKPEYMNTESPAPKPK